MENAGVWMSGAWPVGRRVTPLARRRLLGLVLRELCGASGLGLNHIAADIEHHPTWVAKAMRGALTPHPNEVRVLLAAVGVDPTCVGGRSIVALARSAYDRSRWWSGYADVVPGWFARYLGLESEVDRLCVFDGQTVPDLLQTEAYARAQLPAGDDLDHRVALRLARQEVLALPRPPLLDVILDESVLLRRVGAPRVLRDQLLHLLAVTERRNVRIRVLPFATPCAPPARGPFTLLEFARPPAPLPRVADPGLGYVELLGGAVYVDDPTLLTTYRSTWSRLNRAALDPLCSRTLIERHARARRRG
jgi:hypothetical protein